MRIKDDSVRLPGDPRILWAFQVADQIMGLYDGKEAILTSGAEGYTKHGKTSLHYDDKAIDLRSKHLREIVKDAVLADLKAALGVDFDVLLEHRGGTYEHFHIEWQPKRR